MKELYTSPEMKVLCFAPVERLANNNITMDELIGKNELIDANDAIISTNDDIDVGLDLSL